jgi:hypothetical protein
VTNKFPIFSSSSKETLEDFQSKNRTLYEMLQNSLSELSDLEVSHNEQDSSNSPSWYAKLLGNNRLLLARLPAFEAQFPEEERTREFTVIVYECEQKSLVNKLIRFVFFFSFLFFFIKFKKIIIVTIFYFT